MEKMTYTILLAVLLGLGWGFYETRQVLQDTRQQLTQAHEINEQQQQQLEMLHNEVVRLNQRVTSLDKNSVEGIVREANQAILEGWESLVNTVEEELKKAMEKSAGDSSSEKSQPAVPPTLESPDGTDRT